DADFGDGEPAAPPIPIASGSVRVDAFERPALHVVETNAPVGRGRREPEMQLHVARLEAGPDAFARTRDERLRIVDDDTEIRLAFEGRLAGLGRPRDRSEGEHGRERPCAHQLQSLTGSTIAVDTSRSSMSSPLTRMSLAESARRTRA